VKGDIISAWEQYFYTKFHDSTLSLSDISGKPLSASFLRVECNFDRDYTEQLLIYNLSFPMDIDFKVSGVSVGRNVWMGGVENSLTDLQRRITNSSLIPSQWYCYTVTVTAKQITITYVSFDLRNVLQQHLYPSDELFLEGEDTE
jgi:hypothetical protein